MNTQFTVLRVMVVVVSLFVHWRLITKTSYGKVVRYVGISFTGLVYFMAAICGYVLTVGGHSATVNNISLGAVFSLVAYVMGALEAWTFFKLNDAMFGTN